MCVCTFVCDAADADIRNINERHTFRTDRNTVSGGEGGRIEISRSVMCVCNFCGYNAYV